MAREAWIEATTIADLLDREASRNDGEALVFPDERVTYPGLAGRASGMARALRGLGVGPGDNVGIMLPNSVDYMAALFGIAKLGAIPVPVNLRFKETELGHVVRNADLRVLLTTDRGREFVDFADLVARALPGLADQDGSELRLEAAPLLRQVVMVGDSSPPGFLPAARFNAGADTVDPEEIERLQERVCISDVAMIMYTSGTTARPKGAMLTHEGLTRMAGLVATTRYCLSPDDSFWTPLPMFHIGGTIGILACVSVGCRCCHVGVMDGARALDQIERERVAVAFPTFEQLWLPVVTQPRFPEADLSALRVVQCTGSSPRLLALHREYLPQVKQIAASGLTEATSYTSMNRPSDDEESRIYTHGPALPGVELRIVDPTGADLPAGERGELLVRGFGRFVGYYRDAEATAAAIDDDGWLHTGDLGVIDAQGRHTFVGRIKDMLKVGGENVAAAEIEDYLVTHPAVALAQVVAAPDARYGEVPAAFVELVPGASVTDDELIAYCVGRIATFKVPRYVRVVDEWPMSGTKVRKGDLRTSIARELNERGITEAPRIKTPRSGPSSPG